MGNSFSLIDTFNCNVSVKKNRDVNRLYKVSKQLKISVLPISESYQLEDLYPIHNNVNTWNYFVVGKNKDYICAYVGNKKCLLSESHLGLDTSKLINTKGINYLPDELWKFFDSTWDITLKGKSLCFYIVMNGKLYLINTFPLRNNNNDICGGSLFMRDFESIPKNAVPFAEVENNIINNAINHKN